jgi:hypothetical protein
VAQTHLVYAGRTGKVPSWAGVTESSILFVVAGCSSDYNDKWFPVARSFVKGENPKLGTKNALEGLGNPEKGARGGFLP